MGRNGHADVLLGLAALGVVVAGVGVALFHHGDPIANASTTLEGARHASIVTPAGVRLPARDGLIVPRGALVQTGPRGTADLVTRGRIVNLGPNGALQVVNGARQQLRTGDAVVDAQHGPGVMLDLATDSVSVPGGSATEAVRSFSVRVGALVGPAKVTSSTGRELNVAGLAQAVINGDALPDGTTPLQLTDSTAEASAAPSLVTDDLNLKRLAAGIDSTSGVGRVVTAAWTGTQATMPRSATASEVVLPILIADSATKGGGTPQSRYDDVVGWRSAGGSWGVVDQLLKGRASGVLAALEALAHQPAGSSTGGVDSLPGLTQPTAASAASPAPSSTPTVPSTSPTPTATRPTHAPSASPTPSSGPVKQVVTTVTKGVTKVVRTVVKKVRGLLPPPIRKILPKPQPSPSGGLIGGILGSL